MYCFVRTISNFFFFFFFWGGGGDFVVYSFYVP